MPQPTFDSVWATFANAQTVVFVLCIYILTYALRHVVRITWKGAEKNIVYTELALPLGPIGNGMILAFVVKQASFFPSTFGDSITSKLMYGAVCGLFSGWVYSRIRSVLKARLGGKDDSNAPVPAETKADAGAEKTDDGP